MKRPRLPTTRWRRETHLQPSTTTPRSLHLYIPNNPKSRPTSHHPRLQSLTATRCQRILNPAPEWKISLLQRTRDPSRNSTRVPDTTQKDTDPDRLRYHPYNWWHLESEWERGVTSRRSPRVGQNRFDRQNARREKYGAHKGEWRI